ncbi:ABC transporter ATP-binding protein [Nocardioides sp. LHD-245]|uniref:ABC transporter ATP-binding protein n=1 Tax=Nocardioides sp. LHD-245 TaxID=3051387 RepID=UPI0027E0FC33|nr:ABC transporter ATP-binding protein [Nocardioides sp. LHD-245]
MVRNDQPLLDVRGLSVAFRTRGHEQLSAVQELSVSIDPGGSLALVGESGSGKSVSMRALLGLLPANAVVGGSARWSGEGDVPGGTELIGLAPRAFRAIRGRQIGMVFQNAMQALNPTIPLKRQLTEHLRWHGSCTRAEAEVRAVRALGDVGIPDPERRIRMYPFQLSGGMRQRAMIAMAMVADPRLLIADEPTTAVDVTVQKQILDLLIDLRDRGTAIIMVTHDLGVARYLCEDVAVLYSGQVMESARLVDAVEDPRHPYTRGLIGSALELGDDSPLRPIGGNPPDLADRPAGCAFQPRCTAADGERCAEVQPLVRLADAREVRCWRSSHE